MKVRSPKANQWSKLEMKPIKLISANILPLGLVIPFAIATENESIAKLKAMSIVIIFMASTIFKGVLWVKKGKSINLSLQISTITILSNTVFDLIKN